MKDEWKRTNAEPVPNTRKMKSVITYLTNAKVIKVFTVDRNIGQQ